MRLRQEPSVAFSGRYHVRRYFKLRSIWIRGIELVWWAVGLRYARHLSTEVTLGDLSDRFTHLIQTQLILIFSTCSIRF